MNRSQCFGLERRRPPGLPPGEPGHLVQGIHNNRIENAIRPTAVGKKNWLFMGDADAGQRGAILYTVIENCRRQGIDPYAYLREILTKLPTLTNRQIKDWTPAAYARRLREQQRAALRRAS